jgi:hypothetical protein
MNTKSFLIILSIISFFNCIPTNCSQASPECPAGGGSAGAGDPGEESSQIITFNWLPEEANTFTLFEINTWRLELAIEKLKLTTLLKEYLETKPWFVSYRDLVINKQLTPDDSDTLTDEIDNFSESYKKSNSAQNIVTQFIMHYLLNPAEELILKDEDDRIFEDCKTLSCSICLDTKTKQSFYRLPTCGHFLHTSCLMQMLDVNPDSKFEIIIQKKFLCPLCRKENYIESL